VDTEDFGEGDVRRVRQRLSVRAIAVTVCCTEKTSARREIMEGILAKVIVR